MKKVLVYFLLVFNISAFAQETGIIFSSDSLLSQALLRSKKEGKLLFIDCYTTWCGPCKFLASNIFTQKEVGDFYNKNFINLSFDMQKPEGLKIASQYGIKAFPTLMFLDDKGELVHQSTGAGDGKFILKLGETALDNTRNLKSVSSKIKKGEYTAENLEAYFNPQPFLPTKDSILKVYFSSILEKDRLSDANWSLFDKHSFDIENDQFKFFIKNKDQFTAKFGSKMVALKLTKIFESIILRPSQNVEVVNKLRKIDPELTGICELKLKYMVESDKFNQNKKDKDAWLSFVAISKLIVSKIEVHPMQLNQTCWVIYENYNQFNDLEAAKLAKDWSAKSYAQMPDNSEICDTYAHLLFVCGDVKEAIHYEEIAFKKGTESKSGFATFYGEEVERFKKSLK